MLSVAVHVLLLLSLGPMQRPVRRAVNAVEFVLTYTAHRAALETRGAPANAAPSVAPEPVSVRRARRTPARTSAPAPARAIDRAPTARQANEPAEALGAERSGPVSPSRASNERLSEALSARAAALTVVDPNALARAPSDAERLNAAITKGASRTADRVDEPKLQARPEGGYLYRGRGFDATIEPDGHVHMKDRFGTFHIPFVPFQSADGEWRIAILGGSFRLFEWLDRKIGKNDPYVSERRWFLERTRALRERLASERAPRPRAPSRTSPAR